MSKIRTENLRVHRTARIAVLPPVRKPEAVWIILHGYGQLAESFLQAFDRPAFASVALLAPEALSRFYTRGGSGPVGASWMTRECREQEINDYLEYLEIIIKKAKQDWPGCPVHLFGFSQGAATASRIAAHMPEAFARLILWAGMFPPDLPPLKATSFPPAIMVYGNKDPMIPPMDALRQIEHFKNMGISVNHIIFDGQHELNESVLDRLAQR